MKMINVFQPKVEPISKISDLPTRSDKKDENETSSLLPK
jgi:hypothetical protein